MLGYLAGMVKTLRALTGQAKVTRKFVYLYRERGTVRVKAVYGESIFRACLAAPSIVPIATGQARRNQVCISYGERSRECV